MKKKENEKKIKINKIKTVIIILLSLFCITTAIIISGYFFDYENLIRFYERIIITEWLKIPPIIWHRYINML